MQKRAVFINLLHLSSFLTSQCPYISYPHQKNCSFPKGLDPWILPAIEEWIIKNQPRIAAPFENKKRTKSVSRNKNNTFILFFLKRNCADIHDGKSMV